MAPEEKAPSGGGPYDALLALLRRHKSESEPRLSDVLGLGLARAGQSVVPDFAALFAPAPVIQARWFKDETLRLDGYTFENCRFDRCKLITEMANFTFRNCFISPDCTLYFDGPALKTVRLLVHALRQQGRVQLRPDEEGIAATKNPDGTFTLE